jgi:transposase
VDSDIEKRTAKKPVHRPLPDHLEVVEERLEPADKTCSHCGREQCLVREESSERLDLIPARLIRRRTVRPVYACSASKDQNPVQVPMPPQVIDKAGAALVTAWIFSIRTEKSRATAGLTERGADFEKLCDA